MNGFTAVSKLRKSSGRGSNSRLVEVTTDFKVNKRSVNIVTSYYINGYFSEKTDMQLHR